MRASRPPTAISTLLSCPSEFEDDKISLPFVVTDLRGRNLRPMREQAAVQVGVGGGAHKEGRKASGY